MHAYALILGSAWRRHLGGHGENSNASHNGSLGTSESSLSTANKTHRSMQNSIMLIDSSFWLLTKSILSAQQLGFVLLPEMSWHWWH